MSTAYDQVPYVGMRGFCALMGAITIPVVYATMRESGYPIAIAVFSAALILFGRTIIPVSDTQTDQQTTVM